MTEPEPGNPNPTIYLAGPVNYLDDGGASWRKEVIDEYGDIFDFKNPLDQYNVPVEDLTVVDESDSRVADTGYVTHTEIVESDKQMLRESDGVLIGYVKVKSIGTPMECMWAHDRRYPIGLWIRDDTDHGDLETWYLDHCPTISHDRNKTLQAVHRQIQNQSTFERLYSRMVTRMLTW
jgi:hypothetical protein